MIIKETYRHEENIKFKIYKKKLLYILKGQKSQIPIIADLGQIK